MKSRLDLRRILVAVLAGVLIGGGLMAVTPAGAEVARAAATNWKKIWKNNLQPLADKRYYTKKKSDSKFLKKKDATATYQPKGNYALNGSSYTKAESDAKYEPYPTVIRGSYAMINGGTKDATEIDFGVSLSAPPTVHVIAPGAVPPPGCRGSLTAPDADPGNLCVFQRFNTNESSLVVCNVDNGCNTTSTFGAWLISFWDGSGGVESLGSWALRPSALAPPAARPSTGARGGGSAAGVTSP